MLRAREKPNVLINKLHTIRPQNAQNDVNHKLLSRRPYQAYSSKRLASIVLQVLADSEGEGPLGRTGPRRTRLQAPPRSSTNAYNLRGSRRAHHSKNERAME
jgi:hypothetical protein